MIGIYTVKSEGKEVDLIKLRNPWGCKEWNGDWSDKSSKWTDEIKKQLNFNNSDDGEFYMEFKEYLKFFDKVYTCCLMQN